MRSRVLVAALFLTLCPQPQAQDACANPQTNNFDAWILSQVSAVLCKQEVGQNGKGSERQRESPSADPRSTSLVDQSSASDFFSVAANVIPVTPGLSQVITSTGSTSSSPSAAGSTTATASLYALLAGLNKVGPTDPTFYKDHVNARRFFFTVGTAASKQATDNTDTPAAVYGTKVLLINHRELYREENKADIAKVQNTLSTATAASAVLTRKIMEIMCAALSPDCMGKDGSFDKGKFGTFQSTALIDKNIANTIAALPADARKQIQDVIEGSIVPFSALRSSLQNAYDKISKGMQMSVAYTADIRDAKGNNDHRAEFIFDYGLSPRINWTVNASADYTDRKSALDSKGGRFATSFQGDLTKSDSAWGKTPIRLTFSGEAKWLTSQKPQYTFESKLSIPLASGIDLPVVYRYANRIAQINQTDSEARLGLSVDISRLAQAFK